jgi:hypothetical protein
MWRVEGNCKLGPDMNTAMSCLVTDGSFFLCCCSLLSLHSMCFKRIPRLDVLHLWLEWRRCLRIFSQSFLVLHSFFFACFLRGKTLIFMVESDLIHSLLTMLIVFTKLLLNEICCISKVHGSERILPSME